MKISVLLSIYNRPELLELGLASLANQTMPKQDFEIVIVDDRSTTDLQPVIKKFPHLHIKHIKIDPTSHPDYRGYHTQSLALNIAAKAASGDVLCISQPEIVHDIENLSRGHHQAQQNELVYGQTILTHKKFTDWVLSDENKNRSFDEQWKEANRLTAPFADNELYWYVAFVERSHFFDIHGVEESYMQGVYAEDDEFKERLRLKGVLPVLNKAIRGIHINHEFEADLYPKQDRNASFWHKGAEINRSKFYEWLGKRSKEDVVANKHLPVWGDEKYIVDKL